MSTQEKNTNGIIEGVIWKQILIFFLPDFNRNIFSTVI